MKWSKFISESELTNVSANIKDIEKYSSAEMVAVIANKSSTTKHIKFTLFLLLTIVAFVCLYGFDLIYYFENTTYLIVLVHIVNIIASVFLSRFFIIQRLFVPKQDRVQQVETLAELEFYKQRINMTRSKTGLLIYLSLMEKHTVVLCDKSIAEKLPQETWTDIVDIINTGARKQSIGQGLSNGVKECSERLKKHFPVEPNDINELPNHVILITNP